MRIAICDNIDLFVPFDPADIRTDEERFMARAIELALKGAGKTSPNPLVGAVITQGSAVVGEGYHEQAGKPHAEVNALRAAGDSARGATMYVNLEPCNHHGRTPPCTEAIIAAGIKRVVIATRDPNPLVNGQGVQRLRAAGVDVVEGVLAQAGKTLNEAFFHFIRTGRPFVVLKYAMTLDGKAATAGGQSRWISGEASRQCVHQLRSRYDAVMTGIGTVLADDPMLTARPSGSQGRDPIRIILDSRLRIPLDAKLLHLESEAPTWIVTTPLAPAAKRAALEDLAKRAHSPLEVLTMPVHEGRVELPTLMRELGGRGVTSLLLEGGASLNGAALTSGIVDKIVCFIAPKIFGGATAPGPVGGAGVAEIGRAWRLTRIRLGLADGDIVITGYIGHQSPEEGAACSAG